MSGVVTRVLPMEDVSWLAIPVGVVVAGLVLVAAPVSGPMATMLAITAFCICLWIGTPVAPWLTGLVCIGLLGTTFSTDIALTGFQSAATWLIVLGILLGEATRESGLAGLVERGVLAAMPADRVTDANAAYRYLLSAFSLTALLLVVLVPSSLVRVLLLGPILASVGDMFEERRAMLGIFLGPLFVTYYGATGILTGSLANIIITGIVESNAGVAIGWVEWAIWLGPVMAIGRSLVVVIIAYVLYHPTDDDSFTPATDHAEEFSPNDAAEVESFASSGPERRMLGFLLVGVVIWATDSIHGLHPLYGALVVVLLAFSPKIGVVGPDVLEDADVSIVFFIGAIFAIAAGLQHTGFTDLAAQRILSILPADASLPAVLVFVVLAALALTVVMEGLAVASVLTPVLVSFAASAGLPLLPIAMTEAIALNAYFFPYQSAVLVGILSLNVAEPRELVRMTVACTLATLLVLLPVQIGIFALAF